MNTININNKEFHLINYNKMKFKEFAVGNEIFMSFVKTFAGISDINNEKETTKVFMENANYITTELALKIIAFSYKEKDMDMTKEHLNRNIEIFENQDYDYIVKLSKKIVPKFINFFQKRLMEESIQTFSQTTNQPATPIKKSRKKKV